MSFHQHSDHGYLESRGRAAGDRGPRSVGGGGVHQVLEYRNPVDATSVSTLKPQCKETGVTRLSQRRLTLLVIKCQQK